MKKIIRATIPLTNSLATIAACVCIIGLFTSSQLQSNIAAPTLTTDKSDYMPGDIVTINGSGWVPGEPVALHIDESDGDLPWDATVVPDVAGSFSNSDFVIQAHDIGVLFILSATQGSLSTWTQFTDVVGPGIALNGDPGGFEIQGGVVATAGGGHTDWLANGVGTTGLLTNPGGVPIDSTVTFRRVDGAGNTSNTNDDVFDGAHKTPDNPSTYTWKTAGANNKDDLNNVYVHTSKDSNVPAHTWITASADRLSNNGTAFVDFELNQAAMTQVCDLNCGTSTASGHFVTNPAGAVAGDPLFASGGRTVDDLLVTAQYNQGGAQATIIVYQWQQCTVGSPCTIPSVTTGFGWRDITASIGAAGAFVATNTADGASVPYGAFGLTTYLKNQFVEMSIDVTALIQAAIDPCVGIIVQNVFTKTKVSTSASSNLDDFATPINASLNAGFVTTVTPTGVKCFGGSDGTITVSADGGTPPYTVTLDGANPKTILLNGGSVIYNGVSAGSHTVHVVATGGCAKDTPVTISQPAAAVTASVTGQTNVSCFGGSDGSMTVTFSGGTPGYQCDLDGGGFSSCTSPATFSGLASGSHTVTVKDSNGCTAPATTTITQPSAAISASETTSPVSCHGGNDGQVTVTASGGTSPYSVTVNGVTHSGVTSSTTFTGLATGTYPASITDAKGCTGSATGVLVGEPAAITASETTSPASCHGGSDGSVTVTVSGGTSPYSVTVNGVTHSGVTSSTTFTGLATGTYPASITDAHGCTGSATGVLVGEPTAITASETTSPASCHGGSDGSVTVTVSGGTSPYSVTVNGVTHSGVTSSTTFTGLATGTYPASITDANGCTGSATGVLVGEPTAITASETTSPASCHGGSDGSVTVTVSGGTSPYSVTVNGVTHSGVTSSTTFTGLATGTYPASITDAHGCTGSATGVLVGEPAAIVASETTSPVSCHGGSDGSVTVTVSGGTSPYSVTVNGVTHSGVTSSTTFTGLATGTYPASITDANGCTGSATGVLVGEPAAIVASETTSPVSCHGGSDGSVTVTVSGGTSPYSVTVNGVTHSGVTSSTTFTGLATGTYPASITDANGCTGSATGVLVGEPAAIVASETTSPASCHGGSDGSVTVTVSGGTSPYSVTVNGVTHTGVTSSTTFTGLATGTYPASITDANLCTGSATGVLVGEPAAIVASETATPVSCNGGTDGTVTVNVSGGTAPYSVTVNGVTHSGVTSSTTFTGLAAGNYPATITDAQGCAGSATAATVNQPPAITASETTSPVSCNGATDGSVTVNVSGGTAPYSVTVNGVTHTGVTSSTTFTGLASGTYPASITDANGCAGSATGVIVGSPAAITASETATPVSCNGGTDGSVTVFVSGGTAPYSVTVNGVTHTGVTGSTTFTGLAAGNYPASITDAHGCAGTAAAATVTQPTAVTASSSKTNPLCSSDSTGSMTVTFSGGTPGYQCSLDGGAFSSCTSPATFSNLGAGSHTVNVRDSHLCTGPTQTQTIVIPAPLVPTVTVVPASGPGQTDGSATVSVTGGTPPYTVVLNGVTKTISSSGGSVTFTGLGAGSYTGTITDANGCGVGFSAIVTAPTVEVRLCSILPSIGAGGKTTFQFSLPGGPLSTPLTVFYSMSGTATPGVDYKLSGIFGQVTIPAGQTVVTVTITATGKAGKVKKGKKAPPTVVLSAIMTIVPGPGYFAQPGPGFDTATVLIRK